MGGNGQRCILVTQAPQAASFTQWPVSEALSNNMAADDIVSAAEYDCALHETGFFEDCSRPMLFAMLKGDCGRQTEVDVLLDSGSELDLISEEVATAVRSKWRSVEALNEKRWSII